MHILDAVKICKNDICIVGALSELSVDINDRDKDNVVITYRGVVNIRTAYIQIYGSVSNNSPTFKSTADTLSQLNANIKTISHNGDIESTEYNDKASMVYISGRVATSKSINVRYISSTTQDKYDVTGELIGVPLERNGKIIKVLVITSYYHNIIEIECGNIAEWQNTILNKTVSFKIDTCSSKEIDRMPIYLSVKDILHDHEIDTEVINNALTEHEIFLNSMRK